MKIPRFDGGAWQITVTHVSDALCRPVILLTREVRAHLDRGFQALQIIKLKISSNNLQEECGLKPLGFRAWEPSSASLLQHRHTAQNHRETVWSRFLKVCRLAEVVKALNGIFRIALVSNSYSKSDSLACLNWIQPVPCFIQLRFRTEQAVYVWRAWLRRNNKPRCA